jgi:hypothetical protein
LKGEKKMNYTEIRKLSLKFFIGFLGLTAVVAIVSVLGGEFGELQWKILATTLTISAASILSMACAAFIEKKKSLNLGMSGIVLSIVAAVLLIIGIWPEIDSELYWRTTISVAVVAVGFAHGFLLVLPDLDDKQKWIQSFSTVTIGILCLLIVAAILGDINNDIYFRILAVVAIIAGLETLTIPILMKLQKGGGQRTEKLVLEKVENGIYTDAAGKRYELREIDAKQEV